MSLRRVRDGRLEDFFREPVVLIARQLMDAEISGETAQELDEVTPETRVTHRNGVTRGRGSGGLARSGLLLTRMRQGSYLASFPGPRRRSEHAIVTVVLEA
jgi:transposase-like protein